MSRPRRIDESAKGTTVSLTRPQRLALEELQLKRQKKGLSKPLLNEVFLEGFLLVLEKEGWPREELERVFPKREPAVAKVRVLPRRRRTSRA